MKMMRSITGPPLYLWNEYDEEYNSTSGMKITRSSRVPLYLWNEDDEEYSCTPVPLE